MTQIGHSGSNPGGSTIGSWSLPETPFLFLKLTAGKDRQSGADMASPGSSPGCSTSAGSSMLAPSNLTVR